MQMAGLEASLEPHLKPEGFVNLTAGDVSISTHCCTIDTTKDAEISGLWTRSSGIEDLDENSSAGGSVGLSHDVLNVLFYGLFSNLEGISDFFIGPPFCQMFND